MSAVTAGEGYNVLPSGGENGNGGDCNTFRRLNRNVNLITVTCK